jgi:hypothetical protein
MKATAHWVSYNPWSSGLYLTTNLMHRDRQGSMPVLSISLCASSDFCVLKEENSSHI